LQVLYLFLNVADYCQKIDRVLRRSLGDCCGHRFTGFRIETLEFVGQSNGLLHGMRMAELNMSPFILVG
jgi:hypothetical protein